MWERPLLQVHAEAESTPPPRDFAAALVRQGNPPARIAEVKGLSLSGRPGPDGGSHTLTMDRTVSARLQPHVPAGVRTVAESGLRSPADVREMGARGL
jgi:indole-3-glycerol phosphate synthase